MDAYENLGTTVPSERKKQRKKAKRPENWGKTHQSVTPPSIDSVNPKNQSSMTQEKSQAKKWWEFWK